MCSLCLRATDPAKCRWRRYAHKCLLRLRDLPVLCHKEQLHPRRVQNNLTRKAGNECHYPPTLFGSNFQHTTWRQPQRQNWGARPGRKSRPYKARIHGRWSPAKYNRCLGRLSTNGIKQFLYNRGFPYWGTFTPRDTFAYVKGNNCV